MMLRPLASSARPRASMSNDAAVVSRPMRSANLMLASRTRDPARDPGRNPTAVGPAPRRAATVATTRASTRAARGQREPQADPPRGERHAELRAGAGARTTRNSQHQPIGLGFRQVHGLRAPPRPN